MALHLKRQPVRWTILASVLTALQPFAAPAAETVSGWGTNYAGHFCDERAAEFWKTPAVLSGLGEVKNLSAGEFHCLAVKADGSVVSWGYNYEGQLGTGQVYSLVPKKVLGEGGNGFLSGVTQVSAGSEHSLALKADGSVLAWGNNSSGELGINSNRNAFAPARVAGVDGAGYLTDVSQIYAAGNLSLALKTDGSVLAWGAGANPAGKNTSCSPFPVRISGVGGEGYLTDVTQISAGWGHRLALKSDGSVVAWGCNYEGQVGNNSAKDCVFPPVKVVDGKGGFLSGVIQVCAGGNHSLALKSDGSVVAWGLNFNGQLGNNSETNAFAPVTVQGVNGNSVLAGVTKISAGMEHSLALKSDGSVFVWGENSSYQLGDGTTTTRYIPVKIEGLNKVTGILSGINVNASFAFKKTPVKDDFDDDGISDILWRNSADGSAAIWLMSGAAAKSADIVFRPNPERDEVWTPVLKDDFDGDGHSDILWRNPVTGGFIIWLMLGLDMYQVADVRNPVTTEALLSGDFDGDGKADILWRGVEGEIYMSLMSAENIKSSLKIFEGGSSWTPVCAADFDGDGRADILWRDSSSGAVAIWLMNGLKTLDSKLIFAGDGDWSPAAAGDFDGDGRADIVWRRNSDARSVVWLMDGMSMRSYGYIYDGGDAGWKVAGTGDFDGDGKADILWRHETRGAAVIYFMDGAALKSWGLIFDNDPVWDIVK
jgi:alpha-tubulin suppressor-like RCC1 family protein